MGGTFGMGDMGYMGYMGYIWDMWDTANGKWQMSGNSRPNYSLLRQQAAAARIFVVVVAFVFLFASSHLTHLAVTLATFDRLSLLLLLLLLPCGLWKRQNSKIEQQIEAKGTSRPRRPRSRILWPRTMQLLVSVVLGPVMQKRSHGAAFCPCVSQPALFSPTFLADRLKGYSLVKVNWVLM